MWIVGKFWPEEVVGVWGTSELKEGILGTFYKVAAQTLALGQSM